MRQKATEINSVAYLYAVLTNPGSSLYRFNRFYGIITMTKIGKREVK